MGGRGNPLGAPSMKVTTRLPGSFSTGPRASLYPEG
jgi:hypothetical protein